MSSSALETQGVLIQRGDNASPNVWSAIPEIVSFDGPGGSASEIDVSDLDSTAREFRMGLKDEGDFSFEMMYLPNNTVHSGLQDDRTNRTLRNFRVVLTDSPQSTMTFTAYVREFSVSGGVDDVIRASVTLRISGAVTIL